MRNHRERIGAGEQLEVEEQLIQELPEEIGAGEQAELGQQQVVIGGVEPQLVEERQEALKVEQRPFVPTTRIDNIPEEKPSEPDQIDHYIDRARSLASTSDDPVGMFSWYLAQSFVNGIKADPLSQHSTFDKKLDAFLEKLDNMPGGDRSSIKNQFLEAVNIQYRDYLNETTYNIWSQSSLEARKEIINSQSNRFILKGDKEHLIKGDKERLIDNATGSFNWWREQRMETWKSGDYVNVNYSDKDEVMGCMEYIVSDLQEELVFNPEYKDVVKSRLVEFLGRNITLLTPEIKDLLFKNTNNVIRELGREVFQELEKDKYYSNYLSKL